MKRIPDDVTVDDTTINVKLGGLNMPMSDEMVKKYCGHLPKTKVRAQAMVDRFLKGKVLEFPNNISFGEPSKWDKRQERIERKRRREAGLMKVTINMEMEEDFDDREVSLALLNIEKIKKIKSVNKRGATFELEKLGVTQKVFEETIYPEIKEKLKEYVKSFEGHDFAD